MLSEQVNGREVQAILKGSDIGPIAGHYEILGSS